MRRPNLLLIVAEELRADTLSCLGNAFCPTRAIDQLAAEGALFRHHYAVHGKCVPSRVAMITGTYPSALGCRDLDTYPGTEHDGNAFAALRAAGWRTALIGKNHVMPASRLAAAFDHVPPPGPTFQQYSVDDVATLPPLRRALCQGRIDQPPQALRDWRSVDQAAAFIDACAGEPFAVWLNFENAHPPYAAPDPWWSAIDRRHVPPPRRCGFADKPAFMGILHRTWGCDRLGEEELVEIKAAYHAQVLMVDAMVARVRGLLAARGLLEDTIIAFTADHGDWAGEFGLVEKWDTAFHDELLRVPLILRGPGVERGAQPAGFSQGIDVLPTLFTLLGLPVWERAQHGRSWADQVGGGSGAMRASAYAEGGIEPESLARLSPLSTGTIYWGKHACLHEDPTTLASARMRRDERWKTVVRTTGRNELYDLATDPGECANRWDDPGCTAVRATQVAALAVDAMAACPRLPRLPERGATA